MARSSRLRLADVRAADRLAGECRELGDDPTRWRAHFLARVAALTGAGVAIEYEGVWEPFELYGLTDWGWDGGRDRAAWEEMNAAFAEFGIGFNPMYHPYLAAVAAGRGACLTRADVVPDRAWYGSAYYRDYHRRAGGDAMMYSFGNLPDGRRLSSLVLVRDHGDPNYPARARAVVAELHARVAPLIGGPLAGVRDPSPAALAPRTREVLRCFLEGDSDKQTAARLGLTRNTVNQHAKAIHRHFGVRSRAELLARWVRRGWPSGYPWADPPGGG